MNISGTLHLYSGKDRELFFTFDDDVAQELYASAAIPDLKAIRKETLRIQAALLLFFGYLNAACGLSRSGLERRSMRWMALS